MALRRSHKKSRHGCQECKRRHVKCDEDRPTCGSCSAFGRTCVYLPSNPRTLRSHSVSSTHLPHSAVVNSSGATVPASVPLTPQVSTPSTFAASVASSGSTATSSAQHGALHPSLNLRHMELFSHFILDTGPSLDEGRTLTHENIRIMLSAAFSAPYLMYQILAFSALHLSCTTPAQAEYHREEATTLQTQALLLLNDTLVETTSDNCVPTLIFTSLLGLHALAEAASVRGTDGTDGVLDRFVTYLNLHRGVRAVTQRSWKVLSQSNLQSMLRCAERSLDPTMSQLQECETMVADHLNSLLNDADISADSEKACRDAVSSLQLIFQSESSAGDAPRDEQKPVGLVWAWPILTSGIFSDLLMKRRPEALIILCHYAVLLHRRRHIWLVGSMGRMLIETITGFLGTYWRHWLDWPIQMLEES